MTLLFHELNYSDFPEKHDFPPKKIVRFRRNTKEFLQNSITHEYNIIQNLEELKSAKQNQRQLNYSVMISNDQYN